MNVIISCMQLENYHYAVLFEDSYPVTRLAESTRHHGWMRGYADMLDLCLDRGYHLIRVETPCDDITF